MNVIVKNIPNALTLTNLLMGTMAIIAVTVDRIPTALAMMGVALLADILDGAIARKLKIDNALGVQLDSLADIISFGALPSVMIFYMGSRYGAAVPDQMTVAVLAALNAGSAGLRLARFNVDERPREYFWGLATPAGAMLIAGWLWAQYNDRDLGFGVGEKPWLIAVIPVFLVVAYQASVKLPGLKSPKTGLYIAAILAVAVVFGLFVIGPISIPAGILLYYMIGLINYVVKMY